VDVDAVAFSTTAVCFVPPSAELSSRERAEQIRILEICQIAAQAQGVEVVPFGNEQCLAATTTWETRDTGVRESECKRNLPGGECPSTGVHMKLLKLTLSRPGVDAAISHTTATILSNFEGFSAESFRTLCTAAFHDYPSALSDVEFDVPSTSPR
jgi:hypothetical protein